MTKYTQKIKDILKKMTLEEKSELCMGKNDWSTREFPHLGIPAIMMTDGTNGVRFNMTEEEVRAANGGKEEYTFFDVTTLTQDSDKLKYIYPATCFPSGSAIACSWDRELVKTVAGAVAKECKRRGLSLLLGPGMNIRRCPLGGRSFEYFSEDPVVSGEIAAAYVEGLQENGVGGTIKHITCNNSEHLRTFMDSIVEERPLREIFLAGFERALKAKPWAVMSSYNRLNGVQMAENKRILNDILRDEWGFEGFVVSDWYAIKDRVAAAEAGNDMEMPYVSYNLHALSDAVQSGKLEEPTLDLMCERILQFVFRAADLLEPDYPVDDEAHHCIARQAMAESCVLLKNEGNTLPLNPAKTPRILVAGGIAKTMRYQGGGSALINPTKLDVPYDEIVKRAGSAPVSYAEGYHANDTTDDALLAEVVAAAKSSDIAIVFAGLAVATDCEGADRSSLSIEPAHIRLIEAVAEVQKNLVVVLCNGESVEMPWIDKASAVLETFMCGQAGGSAIAQVLFGEVNPSGKLTTTFAQRIEDLPAYPEFPGENGRNVYGEGVFVGYRYFDVKKLEPLFPFGHGLSYTTFEYSGLALSHTAMKDTDTLTVSLTVKNTGAVAGKEVVQLYVSPGQSRLRRPERELKGFEKLSLQPGESGTVTFTLSYRDFAYYDPEFSQWVVDSGAFGIHIGASSRDIRLSGSMDVESTCARHVRLLMDTIPVELFKDEQATRMLFDFWVQKGIMKQEDINDQLIEGMKLNFVGLYNILPTITDLYVSKEEFQAVLDHINRTLGR